MTIVEYVLAITIMTIISMAFISNKKG